MGEHEHERRSSKQVEGPEPGSPAMQELVREAEEKAANKAADRAGKERKRERDEGTENPE